MNDEVLSLWRNLMEHGTKCLGEEKYLEAEAYYAQGLHKAYLLSVPEIMAFTLRLLATVRVRLGHLVLAEEGFNEALRLCEEIENAKGMAEAWAGLASVSMKRGNFREAAKAYEHAIRVYPEASPQLRLGMLYADLGQVYTALEAWGKAETAFTQAQELCRQNGYPRGVGELAVLLGELCFKQGQTEEAIFHLKRACQIFAQMGDTMSLSNTLQYLALLYFDQSKYFLAHECQQRAVAICLRIDSREIFSESCYFLSKIEQALERNEESKYYLELSIEHYSEQDLGLALRYQSLAGTFLLLLDLANAEIYYLKALRLFERLQDDLRIGEVYDALAYILQIQKEDGQATYGTSREDKSQIKDEFALEALVRLAVFYEKRRDFLSALECYWKALDLGRTANIETEWLEDRVQRVSKRIRKKR